MNKRNADNFKKILLVLIFVLIAVVVFYRLQNAPSGNAEAELSDVQYVLQKDLDIDYPASPRAVVKYYAQLSQALYQDGVSEKEIEEIGMQMRRLFDAELLAMQSDEEFLASLKTTVASFRQDHRRIINFTITSTADVVYEKNSLGDMSSLYCTYVLQKDAQTYSDREQFLLRRDAASHWKILGWQSANTNPGGEGGGTSDE